MREAAGDVLDVLVEAEDLLHHEDDGKAIAPGGLGEVRGNLTVARDEPRLPGLEPFGAGGDRGLLRDRLDRGRETPGRRGGAQGCLPVGK
jgi:hypothetical protein